MAAKSSIAGIVAFKVNLLNAGRLLFTITLREIEQRESNAKGGTSQGPNSKLSPAFFRLPRVHRVLRRPKPPGNRASLTRRGKAARRGKQARIPARAQPKGLLTLALGMEYILFKEARASGFYRMSEGGYHDYDVRKIH
jgi:hypothetical protein